jgi:hypothetical protein
MRLLMLVMIMNDDFHTHSPNLVVFVVLLCLCSRPGREGLHDPLSLHCKTVGYTVPRANGCVWDKRHLIYEAISCWNGLAQDHRLHRLARSIVPCGLLKTDH